MKSQFLVLISLLLLSSSLFAEEKTLLSGDISHGGYGAIVIKGTQINDEAASLVGFKGGYILNHFLSAGFAGYGMVNDIELAGQPDSLKHLFLGYGGFQVEGIFYSDQLVHFTVGTLFGGGALFQGPDFPGDHDDDFDCDDKKDCDDKNIKMEKIAIIEPEANLELNVAKYMRINLGVSYRFAYGLGDVIPIKSDKISGFAGGISMKFGKF